jgi:magnesium-transporting ATPase (P-type)
MVKGAPERILVMCETTLDEQTRQRIQTQASEMATRGLRVLAFATGVVDAPWKPTAPLQGLRFLGLVGMIDPLRPGVREAVQACNAAGIDVCMITGDHPVTALAIARELGLAHSPDQVITGQQLLQKTPEQLREVVRHIRVFARTSPRQKLELVNAAREAGHFVAVTGDGVNDAPALRAANIGVAMGKSGTDVAREAAELVLTDDSFASIVSGVEEGRVAYDNVRKVIYLLISTGAGLVLLLFLALLTGYPNDPTGNALLPFLPIQLLWLNLVTNGIQDVALAFEPKEGDVLSRKPRPPQEPIFNRIMIERTVIAALVMGLVCYATWCYLIEVLQLEATSARNILLLLMVLFQNFHIGNSRSETVSAFRLSPFTSPILLSGTILAFGIHVLAMHVPLFQSLLGTEPVSLTTWFTIVCLALTIVLAMEIHKLTWAWRASQTPSNDR